MKPRAILGFALILIAALALIVYLLSQFLPFAIPQQIDKIYLAVAAIVGVAGFLAAQSLASRFPILPPFA